MVKAENFFLQKCKIDFMISILVYTIDIVKILCLCLGYQKSSKTNTLMECPDTMTLKMNSRVLFVPNKSISATNRAFWVVFIKKVLFDFKIS